MIPVSAELETDTVKTPSEKVKSEVVMSKSSQQNKPKPKVMKRQKQPVNQSDEG